LIKETNMNSNPKKLSLNKETLKSLRTRTSIKTGAGGGQTSPVTNPDDPCYPTHGCTKGRTVV
jgi:hypothetical protein